MFHKGRLIALRERMGLTRHQVSWQTLIHHSIIEKLETGKSKRPTFQTVETLSDFFGVNMATFSTTTKSI